MTWRDKIASLSVGYFDGRVNDAEGEEEDYLFERVDQGRAYAEFGLMLYGRLFELVADKGLTAEEALDSITEQELDEMFREACSCAEM